MHFSQCCTDFILCYEKCSAPADDIIEQEGQNLDQISNFSESKKALARRKFLEAIQAEGNYRLEYETQCWKVRLRFPQTKSMLTDIVTYIKDRKTRMIDDDAVQALKGSIMHY